MEQQRGERGSRIRSWSKQHVVMEHLDFLLCDWRIYFKPELSVERHTKMVSLSLIVFLFHLNDGCLTRMKNKLNFLTFCGFGLINCMTLL